MRTIDTIVSATTVAAALGVTSGFAQTRNVTFTLEPRCRGFAPDRGVRIQTVRAFFADRFELKG